jgi:oxygen-independent coproporphyrinogen-3 oxidase
MEIIEPNRDADLIAKYDVNGPRYTSYPTANHFSENLAVGTVVDTIKRIPVDQDLSLYVHVPFCDTICYYCACNKIVTNNRKHATRYLDYLYKEMAMVAKVLGGHQSVNQLHFGGGTPTYLNDEQLSDVFETIRQYFNLHDGPERDFSIELDPRTVDDARIEHLVSLGINRVSLGVQDFDPDVQRAINRIQSVEETANIVSAAREQGINSVSVDLIYGLPLQTCESFARTLDQVNGLSPDRISLYSYAHLPNRFKTQKQINVVELPTAATKLDLLRLAIETFSAAGYEYVGMDHFAKRDDSLIVALDQGTLHRNFQGYTTHGDCELIGLGVSAISQIDDLFSQNAKTLEGYYTALDANRLPVERGIVLNHDDHVRRDLILSLMCRFEVDVPAFEQAHQIRFADYFGDELSEVRDLALDGLVEYQDGLLTVTPKGRFFIRNVCMVFDAYLSVRTPGFSRAI